MADTPILGRYRRPTSYREAVRPGMGDTAGYVVPPSLRYHDGYPERQPELDMLEMAALTGGGVQVGGNIYDQPAKVAAAPVGVATPTRNNVVPQPGTVSSAPAPVDSMADVPPSYFTEGTTPTQYPGLSVGGMRAGSQSNVLRPTSLPSHPLADRHAATQGEADSIAQAQAYLDKRYGMPEKGSEHSDVENWKGERRKADAASREAELDPLRYEAKKLDLEQQINDPAGAQEYTNALKAIPPDYLAGKLGTMRMKIQQMNSRLPVANQIPMPTDVELTQMAQADWLEEYGIFKRNKAGRYEVPPQLIPGM